MDEDFVLRLEQKAEYHRREAERYAIAAGVFRDELRGGRQGRNGSRGDRNRSRRPADPRQSTMAMVEAALNDVDRALTPTELVAEMLRLEWQTSAVNPVNTVRTAAHRLVEQGRIQKADDGRFSRLGLPDSDAHADGSAPEASADAPGSAIDPWATPADPDTEEPPF